MMVNFIPSLSKSVICMSHVNSWNKFKLKLINNHSLSRASPLIIIAVLLGTRMLTITCYSHLLVPFSEALSYYLFVVDSEANEANFTLCKWASSNSGHSSAGEKFREDKLQTKHDSPDLRHRSKSQFSGIVV